MDVSNKNMFSQMTQRFGLLPQPEGLNEISKVSDVSTQTFAPSALDKVGREAEFMAQDLLSNYDSPNPRKAPNRHCKTLRRTVKELSDRHDIVFKAMVNRLQSDDIKTLFPTFVIVADEIFDDGQVNWGRIVAVYTFAARLSQKHLSNHSNSKTENYDDQNDSFLINNGNSEVSASYSDKIALFVGRYVANKLGQWILDHGGWEAFVEYFPDQGEFEEKVWKGVLFTAIGLGALATMVVTR